MKRYPYLFHMLFFGNSADVAVANLTRQDGSDYMKLIKKYHLQAAVTTFALENANQALAAIRNGTLEGSAVLKI